MENPRGWLEQEITELSDTLQAFVPNLVAAVALFLLGWLSAFVLRWLICRFGTGLDAIMTLVQRRLGRKVTRTHFSFPNLVGNIAFWITLAYTISSSADQLGLVTLSKWILELLGYLPLILISMFILLIGYLISDGVRNIIITMTAASGFQHGSAVGHMVAAFILAFTFLLALAQLGFDVAIIANIITIAAASLFISAAIAFGIGASDAVRNVMASHYIRKSYRTGQRVRMEEIEGDITEITQVDVVLDTQEGDARIPARRFLEKVSLLVDE
jgi:hypothetical protein